MSIRVDMHDKVDIGLFQAPVSQLLAREAFQMGCARQLSALFNVTVCAFIPETLSRGISHSDLTSTSDHLKGVLEVDDGTYLAASDFHIRKSDNRLHIWTWAVSPALHRSPNSPSSTGYNFLSLPMQ